MINVKICGITRNEDAQLAQNLGAWAIGFVFYPKSQRYIAPGDAQKIAYELKIKKIGVFVNENPEIINQLTQTVGLDYVQLHGEEPVEDCEKLIVPFIKTVRNINEINIYSKAFAYLVDAIDTQNWGGTGKLADWEFAKTVKEKQPLTPTLSRKGRGRKSLVKTFTPERKGGGLKPLILSGGLSSANIKEAIQKVQPDFIDLSSSLETQPGIKNHLAMQEFFDKIKEQYD